MGVTQSNSLLADIARIRGISLEEVEIDALSPLPDRHLTDILHQQLQSATHNILTQNINVFSQNSYTKKLATNISDIVIKYNPESQVFYFQMEWVRWVVGYTASKYESHSHLDISESTENLHEEIKYIQVKIRNKCIYSGTDWKSITWFQYFKNCYEIPMEVKNAIEKNWKSIIKSIQLEHEGVRLYI